MPPKSKTSGKVATIGRQTLDAKVWGICDILRRSNCAGALQYVPELTWILFLRILDETEEREQAEAEVLGLPFKPSLKRPYRWRDWAAPYDPLRFAAEPGDAESPGWQRYRLQEKGDAGPGGFKGWVDGKLLPYLRRLSTEPGATARQKVIGRIMTGVERVRIDTDKNLLDVLDRVHDIHPEAVDDTHVFALSQVYEGLLLKMGEKGNDGGQFFTPREVIRAMVRVIDPRVGETVYDPGCGTGGFLAQAYEHVRTALGDGATAAQLETLKRRMFWGREKETLIYPIALANLVLHGIDEPHIWHGNTLTGGESYAGLFEEPPSAFDVVLTNPPFGGKEGKEAQTRFTFQTGATQVLFLQHVIDGLKPGGRCGIVLDEGVLFRTNETAFVQTKRKLMDDCDLWCIVSLPAGVFTAAGAGVKTNLLFFTKGRPTARVWYFDLSDIKVGKKSPFTLKHFEDAGFFEALKDRAETDRSWTVERKDIEAKGYDLKAVNPRAKTQTDTRTPAELLDIIEAKGREVAEALAILRRDDVG